MNSGRWEAAIFRLFTRRNVHQSSVTKNKPVHWTNSASSGGSCSIKLAKRSTTVAYDTCHRDKSLAVERTGMATTPSRTTVPDKFGRKVCFLSLSRGCDFQVRWPDHIDFHLKHPTERDELDENFRENSIRLRLITNRWPEQSTHQRSTKCGHF